MVVVVVGARDGGEDEDEDEKVRVKMECESEEDRDEDGRGKELRWRLGRIFISGFSRGQMMMDDYPRFPCFSVSPRNV